jgi:glycerol-3-phosphate dehydrogenase (NAD(P)+)
MKIAILGAGAYGTALGDILIERGHDVFYYDPAKGFNDFELAIKDANYTIIAFPSDAMGVISCLPKDKPIILASKGFLDDKLFSSFQDFMVLSGPGFAAEIKARKKTSLTITDKRISELLGNDYFDYDETDDIKGVLMCGSLKNVYAILAGYYDLKTGTDDHNAFIKEVAEEMQTLLFANGANPNTVKLYCGEADLMLTCDSPSRNYQFGQRLKTDRKAQPNETVEGFTALLHIVSGEIKIPENLKHLNKIMEIIWG